MRQFEVPVLDEKRQGRPPRARPRPRERQDPTSQGYERWAEGTPECATIVSGFMSRPEKQIRACLLCAPTSGKGSPSQDLNGRCVSYLRR